MNHLAHLALAGDEPEAILGSFLGDYVKGRLKGQLPAAIERGIRLHRAVDAFTDRHSAVLEAGRRLPAHYRRYAGLVTDLAFDHFLALNWQRYSEESLDAFSRRTLAILHGYAGQMPAAAAATAIAMHEHNSLANYGRAAFVQGALCRVASRLTRPNPLASAYQAFEVQRQGLEEDFHRFYPELMAFSDTWLASH